MALDVGRTTVRGRWLRHTPVGVDPSVRPDPPDDNRWQQGRVVDALYLAREQECAWAEWYRHLAERAVPPQRSLPRDLWTYEIDSFEVADLSTAERLARIDLPEPRPGRGTWPPFQVVGEQLYEEGFAGLLAPSAARPQSLVLCVFIPGGNPPGQVALRRPARRVEEVPVPPTGMRT